MDNKIQHMKSFKRLQRREMFEKFYKNRIKLQMNKYGLQQMLNPLYEGFIYRWYDQMGDMQNRTKDWQKIRKESKWMYKYKDVHKKYKDDDWMRWNEKHREHLNRIQKQKSISEGIDEYNEVKLSK